MAFRPSAAVEALNEKYGITGNNQSTSPSSGNREQSNSSASSARKSTTFRPSAAVEALNEKYDITDTRIVKTTESTESKVTTPTVSQTHPEWES